MENRQVIRSASVVGSFTMLSRFLGLMRDVLMAGFFGASLAMDAFVIAFTIPNLFRRLFGEGALSASFVPVFVEARRKEGDKTAWALARKIITLLGLFLLAVVAIGLVAATYLMDRPELLARLGQSVGRAHIAETLGLVLPLLRIMLPYMFFICLAGVSMGILNSFHHFALPAATPAFLNIVWIATVLFVCPRLGDAEADQIQGVAWAILLAGGLQLSLHVPLLMRHGYQPGFSADWRDERVRKVLRLMGPAALGLAVTQFNVIIDRLLAAWVGEGAPAALFYSERLIYFPLGIFATAMGTVLLPVLSGYAADEDAPKARETINHALRILMFLMIPAAAGLLILAQPIVQMIFEWGRFSAANTDYTCIALQFYAPGLVVFSLAKVFVPAFYARQDTRTPVRVGICTVGLNLLLNVTFVLTWPQHLKHAGLACATVISEGVYALVLAFLLHRRQGSPGWWKIVASGLRVAVAVVVMSVVVVWLQPVVLARMTASGLVPKFAQIFAVMVTVLCGIGVYLAAAGILRCRELGELWAGVRRRM